MKAVCLMSGGIDSPVAAYVMSKVGADIILLHMDNRPYADDRPIERAKMLAARIREETGKDIPLYVAPHGASQKAIADNADSLYQCVLCKHAMQLTAKKQCQKLGARAKVNAETNAHHPSHTHHNKQKHTKKHRRIGGVKNIYILGGVNVLNGGVITTIKDVIYI